MTVDNHTPPASQQPPHDGPQRPVLILTVLSSDGEGLQDLAVIAYPTPTPGLMVHRSPWTPPAGPSPTP
ncbi:MAG: hypothetical protein ACRDZO_05200 [Egibacteraceae bacterium]